MDLNPTERAANILHQFKMNALTLRYTREPNSDQFTLEISSGLFFIVKCDDQNYCTTHVKSNNTGFDDPETAGSTICGNFEKILDELTTIMFVDLFYSTKVILSQLKSANKGWILPDFDEENPTNTFEIQLRSGKKIVLTCTAADYLEYCRLTIGTGEKSSAHSFDELVEKIDLVETTGNFGANLGNYDPIKHLVTTTVLNIVEKNPRITESETKEKLIEENPFLRDDQFFLNLTYPMIFYMAKQHYCPESSNDE